MQTPTNQQFLLLENNIINKLREKITFSLWEKYDNSHMIARFVTSWATTDEEVNELKEILQNYKTANYITA